VKFDKQIIFVIPRVAILLFLIACTPSVSEPEVPFNQVSTLPADSAGEVVIRVGVLAIRSAVSANAQYGPIINYLSESIGRPFVLVPVGQEEQFAQVEQKNLDFTFTNPLAAVQLQRLYHNQFLATISRVNTGTNFSGLIITRSDSGIETLEDLMGKNVTCVAFVTAAGGCIFQVFHLMENGIDPSKDFGLFTETPSQDNIVLGVLNGTFDAGFIRTGQLERMVTDGILFNLDEIRILDQATDDFFYPHTTRLYPEWPFAALESTDPELVQAVQEALLAIPADHPAMENAKANGFVPAVDYRPIHELIETLKLRSWDAVSEE
jgi:ABC-type phosphate/phosphonate transport system substrate-binding protein